MHIHIVWLCGRAEVMSKVPQAACTRRQVISGHKWVRRCGAPGRRVYTDGRRGGEYETGFGFDDGAGSGAGWCAEFGGATQGGRRDFRRGAGAGRQAGVACQRDVSVFGGGGAARGTGGFAGTIYDREITFG